MRPTPTSPTRSPSQSSAVSPGRIDRSRSATPAAANARARSAGSDVKCAQPAWGMGTMVAGSRTAAAAAARSASSVSSTSSLTAPAPGRPRRRGSPLERDVLGRDLADDVDRGVVTAHVDRRQVVAAQDEAEHRAVSLEHLGRAVVGRDGGHLDGAGGPLEVGDLVGLEAHGVPAHALRAGGRRAGGRTGVRVRARKGGGARGVSR